MVILMRIVGTFGLAAGAFLGLRIIEGADPHLWVTAITTIALGGCCWILADL